MTNPLTDRLQQATDDLPARLPGPSAVRAAARARQQRRRVVAGTALAAAIALVALTVGEDAVGDRLLPATGGSSSSPNASPPATSSPAGSPSPTPEASQSPAPSPSQRTNAQPLAGFQFPEEATWKAVANEVTVERSEDLRAQWVLAPCQPTTSYPTDSRRIAMRSLTRLGPEAFDGRQIAVYPDEATAAEVMAGFRRVLAACARSGGGSTTGEQYSSALDIGDEALVTWKVTRCAGQQCPGGGYDVVVRDGRAVYLASVGGEFLPTGPTDAAATELVAVARARLPLPQ